MRRYTESREHSAELLRAALRLMGQHLAGFNPVCFAVWYEQAAGSNGRLNRAIEKLLLERPQLDDADMVQLYRDHIADADQATLQQISSDLQRVMSGVADKASSTGASAGQFGDQIGLLAGALERADPSELPALLQTAASQALEVKDSSAVLVQQISEGRREIERLRVDLGRARDEALLDPLTKVLNRRGLDCQLAALFDTQGLERRSSSLVMVDIDHFKNVNDRHGHLLGDQVIQALAEVLRSAVPEAERRVARYGGEEFAILLPGSRVDEGTQLAELLCQRVRAMKVRDRRTREVVLQVTISAGVAALEPGDDPASWIARADQALYRAKQAGRDRVLA